jgi:hypothetical protein
MTFSTRTLIPCAVLALVAGTAAPLPAAALMYKLIVKNESAKDWTFQVDQVPTGKLGSRTIAACKADVTGATGADSKAFSGPGQMVLKPGKTYTVNFTVLTGSAEKYFQFAVKDKETNGTYFELGPPAGDPKLARVEYSAPAESLGLSEDPTAPGQYSDPVVVFTPGYLTIRGDKYTLVQRGRR